MPTLCELRGAWGWWGLCLSACWHFSPSLWTIPEQLTIGPKTWGGLCLASLWYSALQISGSLDLSPCSESHIPALTNKNYFLVVNLASCRSQLVCYHALPVVPLSGNTFVIYLSSFLVVVGRAVHISFSSIPANSFLWPFYIGLFQIMLNHGSCGRYLL